jgi:hypothetical protein
MPGTQDFIFGFLNQKRPGLEVQAREGYYAIIR